MKKFVYAASAFMLPLLAGAQQSVTSVQQLGSYFISLIEDIAVPVIFALAFLIFIWGVFQYFVAGGADEEKRDKGKMLMLYGLIGFFIMVSVWGLVNILIGSVRLDDTVNYPDPTPNR